VRRDTGDGKEMWTPWMERDQSRGEEMGSNGVRRETLVARSVERGARWSVERGAR
jgi:hypothetical protein